MELGKESGAVAAAAGDEEWDGDETNYFVYLGSRIAAAVDISRLRKWKKWKNWMSPMRLISLGATSTNAVVHVGIIRTPASIAWAGSKIR